MWALFTNFQALLNPLSYRRVVTKYNGTYSRHPPVFTVAFPLYDIRNCAAEITYVTVFGIVSTRWMAERTAASGSRHRPLERPPARKYSLPPLGYGLFVARGERNQCDPRAPRVCSPTRALLSVQLPARRVAA